MIVAKPSFLNVDTFRIAFFLRNSCIIFLPTIYHRSFLSYTALQHSDSSHSSRPPDSTHGVPSDNLLGRSPLVHRHCNRFHDVMSSNRIITSLIRSGDLDSALQLFNSMTVKTTVTWNSILAGFSKTPGKMKDAKEVFDKIPKPDTFSYNTMLACYVHNSDMEKAQAFFDVIPNKDTASWNTLISGFSQNGQMEKAHVLFLMMPNKNAVTWNAMISGHITCGDLTSALKLFKALPFINVVASTAVITGYMKSGYVESAEKLFKDMSIKNVISWNAMISGYIENSRAEDGAKLFKEMVGFGIMPNPSTLSSILLGCSELSALQLGKQIHQLVCKSPLVSNRAAGTSLVSMYCKCGDLEDAWKLFLEIPRKDVVTWNAMISGYAQHGAGEKALSLFDDMKKIGIKPDWITFVAVLLACNHAGFVDLGEKYFHSMVSDYGVQTKPEHYTCMVDLLGRAGKLEAATDLIKNMPFKPHMAIYGTLLGACRVHKNTNMAEFAAKNLLDLDPTCATGYVQLANVYASLKQWDNVAKVRRSMKSNKVVKVPGYSWLEVENEVHKFRSGDRVHPELEPIHDKLKELEKKLKSGGYVPRLEFALHDVEEEQKEQLLLRHSEKLAIAYGLIKLSSGTPIRVFKNLRVCGDCHSAIKYISAIEEREIIVRDSIRFHHFKDGGCSCGDYW